MNLYGLPDISFAEKDPETIKTNIISGYEEVYREATGERITLYPGDPRRLFLLTVADMIILQRNLIDWTAKQNLLAYASGEKLDHLGLYFGVSRLPAQRSRTTVRFTLSALQPSTVVIPAGTRVTPGGSEAYFTTEENLEIPAGEIHGEALTLALAPGGSANGFLPGQINRLVDPLPWIHSVENITESTGGADVEGDENLRERIHLAPESFSVAGPVGAYIYWARTASQLIIDVGVDSPVPGVVQVYPLLADGQLPAQEILDQVIETLNADDIRPTSDYVQVLTPIPVEYNLDVTWYLDRANVTSAVAIQQAVNRAVDDWARWQRSVLGRDLNPSVLIARMVDAGAKRVTVKSPTFKVIGFNQVAISTTSFSATYGGVEDG
ncbi:MAG: baseplate J/gp47 family protein [Synergistaceae bacterium]|nr:baseplate J/gp47 family protein [Synergistaceae bacterium]